MSAQALPNDPPVEPGLTRDPKDDFTVSLARGTRADLIVSGDDDLAAAEDMRPPVLRPAELVDLLRRKAPG